MQKKDFSFDIKAVDEEGTFEGYASVSGNTDSYGDIVEPGAFADDLAAQRRKGYKPPLLWQHNPDDPIGVWDELAEDGKGLWGKARLVKGVSRADEAYLLLKAGAFKGLSIGYRVLESKPDGNKRRLTKLALVEASLVTFPANERAQVTAVKSERYAALRERLVAGDLPSEREFEKGMRDAFDLSASEAERVTRLFFKRFAQGDPGEAVKTDARLAAIARAAAASLKIKA